MRSSVRSVFTAFSTRFEGRVATMYCDVKQLVTIGIGNLIDPLPAALPLPFVHIHDPISRATREEIAAEWWAMKNDPMLAKLGWREAAKRATLKLMPDAIDALVLAKLDQNEDYLAARFPEMGSWPADAQLAIHSMAWAQGAAFHFPKLEAALRCHDFETAIVEGHMEDSKNPGLVPRNAANALLWANAAAVRAASADPEVLHWPDRFVDLTQTPTDPEGIPAASPIPVDLPGIGDLADPKDPSSGS